MLSNPGLARGRLGGLLRDRGRVGTYTPAGDNIYGNARRSGVTYPFGNRIRCSFMDAPAQEAAPTALGVGAADGVILVEQHIRVTGADRFLLTHRHGKKLPVAILYQIIGEPQPDVLLLKLSVRTVVERAEG